jgi:hypothetical protein
MQSGLWLRWQNWKGRSWHLKVNYQYASPSVCLQQGDQTILGLSPDLSREEKVSFAGRLKHPLIFRDAMLMLRQIVISDMRQEKKERVEFFAWLEQEIDKRMVLHEHNLPGVREDLQKDINEGLAQLEQKERNIDKLVSVKNDLTKEINKHDIWRDYYKIERDFWKFIKERDASLWWVLDPVITVHPDQVSFEAFSLDESTYGCLSVVMDEFELLQKPRLGTTNIDFSAKLAREMARFRTYTNVELSVNPGGFTVDTGLMPEYLEKKIDLPETWIKGFNQVSAAASLGGIDIELAPVDMYDICCFLRRHKAHQSPRYMKWILDPGKQVKIIFEPFGNVLTLKAVYTGQKKREEKIWGRRRWLVIEKIIPLARTFIVRLLGFGMPQFIMADLGTMNMTIGFSSWSSNDWVKGTAFNVLGGFIGDGNYERIYQFLKEQRFSSMNNIQDQCSEVSKSNNQAGVGMVFKRGEGYFDPVYNLVRFRQLCNIPISAELYETTELELKVQGHLDEGKEHFRLRVTPEKEFAAVNSFKMPNPNYKKYKYRGTEDYAREHNLTQTGLRIDQEGQISKVECTCKEFNKGSKNISAPCAHILALYVITTKFLKLEFKPDREYSIDDIMEILL